MGRTAKEVDQGLQCQARVNAKMTLYKALPLTPCCGFLKSVNHLAQSSLEVK